MIEAVSFDARVPKGQNLPEVDLLASRNSNWLTATHESAASASQRAITGSELTRIYGGPDSGVECGYLVNRS